MLDQNIPAPPFTGTGKVDTIRNASYAADEKASAYFLAGNYEACLKLLQPLERELDFVASHERDEGRRWQLDWELAEKRLFIGQCFHQMRKLNQAADFMGKAWRTFNEGHHLTPNVDRCAREYQEILRDLGLNREAAEVEAQYKTFTR